MSQILGILESCLSYPSADNCQPFRFRVVSDTEVEIFHDGATAAHRLNGTKIASWLSLGTLLETISLRAGQSGYHVRTQNLLAQNASQDGSSKWAVLHLQKADIILSSDDKVLASALNDRCVNRNLYETAAIAEEDIQWLTAEAQKNLSADLEKVLLNIEEEAWKDERTAFDVLKWIRFDAKTIQASRDGMPWHSLGLKFYQKPFLKLFVKFPAIYNLLAKAGATKENRKAFQNQIQHSAGFGWMALNRYNPQDICEAGRTMFRMWLYLTARGYAYQPMNLATLPSFDFHFDKLPTDWPQNLKKLYPVAIDLIQRDSMMGNHCFPMWGFRTGKAAALPAQARTLRKSMDEITLKAA
ncbi:MAG: hypothetical protein EOP06_32755 [Proteobacteria bacterium]|nr:MAG: hypothetical protein EOP06_32755 [Pseudomonadota bacterium]